MNPACDFRLVDEDLVVCANCGRPVRLKNAASRRVLARCRGEAETRWTCHGKPKFRGHAGTELKKLLASIGVTSTPNCSCYARAREMDARGPDWCEENIDTIVGWLREEATKRGLPFLDVAGRLLVRRAIAHARRAAAS